MSLQFVTLIVSILVASASEYPKTTESKFSSGKLKAKIHYVAYNDIDWAEIFYANGKQKINYKRVEKSSDPYKPDVYSFKSWTDKGEISKDGTCEVSPSENFYPEDDCFRFSGVSKIYREDGKLWVEATYKQARLDGTSITHEKEKVILEEYSKGKIVKRVEKDPATSKIIKTEEYEEDGSIKGP